MKQEANGGRDAWAWQRRGDYKYVGDENGSSRGAHFGINKAISKITEVGLKKDVLKLIGERDKCKKSEKIKTVALFLKPIKAEGPWQMVGVDLMDPPKRKPVRQQVYLNFNWLMG